MAAIGGALCSAVWQSPTTLPMTAASAPSHGLSLSCSPVGVRAPKSHGYIVVSANVGESDQAQDAPSKCLEESHTRNRAFGTRAAAALPLLPAEWKVSNSAGANCECNQDTQFRVARRSSLLFMSSLGLQLGLGLEFDAGSVDRSTPIWQALASALEPPSIDFNKQPSGVFDPTDKNLREAAVIFQQALDSPTVEEEERLWTEVIERYQNLDAEWVNDIVSRAWGNRGNARSRQGRLEEALADYSRSIELAPYAVDPVLNRGVALENLGRFEEAAQDYLAVLEAVPADPAAWNNLGNVRAAIGQWDEALLDYRRAVQLAPEFSFAAANYALALYQVGRSNEAIKQFRTLLRRYPEFPDMRAALAVSLYKEGLTGDAETNWTRLEDLRYRDRSWVRNTRRWPPRLADELEAFLDLKATTAT